MLLTKRKRIGGRNASSSKKPPLGLLSCLLLAMALTAMCLLYSQHGLLEDTTSRYLDENLKNQQNVAMKLASVQVETTNKVPSASASFPLSFRDALVDCSSLKQTFAHVPDPNGVNNNNNNNNNSNNSNNNPSNNNAPKFVAHTHKTPRPYYVSLHDPAYDKTRALLLDKGRYYETTLQDRWSEILLQAPPGVRVLDVGGNIGYYSLFSASLGNFVIDTFEVGIPYTHI